MVSIMPDPKPVTYCQCTRCGNTYKGEHRRCSSCWSFDAGWSEMELVAVLPVAEWDALTVRCGRLRGELTRCVNQLQKQYDNEDCECPPEGHMCGRDQRGRELKLARSALKEAGE